MRHALHRRFRSHEGRSVKHLRAVTTIALVVAAATGCVHTRDSCQKLAWPQTSLTGAALDSCVQRVLEDQLTGGQAFDLWTRARTRDVIVDRRLTHFAPLLHRIASMDVRADDWIQHTSIADALLALTLIRDPAAAAMNIRHLDVQTPALILSVSIGDLTLLKDFSAADKIAQLAASMPADYEHVALLGVLLEHLHTAEYRSSIICARYNDIHRALDDACPPSCRGNYALTRQRLETYAAANCDG